MHTVIGNALKFKSLIMKTPKCIWNYFDLEVPPYKVNFMRFNELKYIYLLAHPNVPFHKPFNNSNFM